MRLLHFADVHLDRPFVGMELEAARRRRAGLRQAFDRCLALARERDVDAVTIGGDLWEDEHVTPDTIRWVADRLTELDRPVVVIAGNHDALSSGGPYDRAPWPENVTVLADDDALDHVDLEGVTIWGLSWRRGIQLTSASLRDFRSPDDGRQHLLLLHGTCGAIFGDGGSHCPFTANDVRRAGFAVCLAGHLHAGGVRDDVVVYPGSPEPLTWSEHGRHAAAILELSATSAPRVELVDVNSARYAVQRVDMHGAASSAEVERRALAAVTELDALSTLHLRIELDGRVAAGCDVDGSALAETLQAAGLASVEVRDNTRPAFDLDALADGVGVRAAFVRRMRERIATDGDLAESALDLGLRALEGDPL